MKAKLFTLLLFVCVGLTHAQVTTINAVLANPCSVLNTQNYSTNLDFSLYPNPSNGNVTIQINSYSNGNNSKIIVYNIKGMIVYENSFQNTENQFERIVPLQNLSNGIYLLTILSGQEKVTKKLIINK
jgi:aminopeptidase N